MKMKAKKSYLAIIAVVVVLLVGVGYGVYAITSKSPVGAKQRMTFYTNYSQLVGGACGYYEYTSVGQKTGKCVDGADQAKTLITPPDPNVGITANYKLDLMKIDAEVHTETQKRSPTTPTPQYKNYQVIVIDKVYSAELVSVSPTPNISQ
jgi:hypothetical protein